MKVQYYCDSMRHLICVPYSVEDLHAMAEDLRIKRHWFHGNTKYPHYDIPKLRIDEIRKHPKVLFVTPRELLRLLKFAMPARDSDG